MTLYFLAIALALCAAGMVVMNYAFVAITYWSTRRGIHRRYSEIPFVTQIPAVLAEHVSAVAPARDIPAIWLLALCLADVSLWLFLYALIRRMRRTS